MALEHALLLADVVHARLRPKKNAFRYRVYYLAFALGALARLKETFLVSVNRFNLFSFRERDYGDRRAPEAWARALLAEWHISEADGDIVLVTLPRLLGITFNPVSFWFCLDKTGQLRAVLSEVSNTFRDRHSYLSFRDDHAPITQNDWLHAEKIFHVSPFLKIEGYYEFRFLYAAERIGVWINYFDSDGLLLTTSLTGRRHALTSGRLLYYFVRYPFMVLGLIHYQALKLALKGIRYHRRPIPPLTEVSR